jgi:Protein of unknown function (DUF1566)
MPNPAQDPNADGGATDLPHPQQYDTQVAADGNAVVVDRVTGLVWQRDVGPASTGAVDGQRRCAELGAQGYAGFTDWRLPSRIELVSIIDFTRTFPAVDSSAFPDTPSDHFWTSSSVTAAGGYAWCIAFDLGDTFSAPGTDMARVRCVR